MGGVALTWLALPQLTDTVIGDANFRSPTQVTGATRF